MSAREHDPFDGPMRWPDQQEQREIMRALIEQVGPTGLEDGPLPEDPDPARRTSGMGNGVAHSANASRMTHSRRRWRQIASALAIGIGAGSAGGNCAAALRIWG